MTTASKRNMVTGVGKSWNTPEKNPQGKPHFGKSFLENAFKSDVKVHETERRRKRKENQTDEKLTKKEESVESAPKSRNKIEWESLSQEKLREIFGPRPERTWFHFDDDSMSEDSDERDDEETEEPVEKRPRGAANGSKNCGM